LQRYIFIWSIINLSIYIYFKPLQ